MMVYLVEYVCGVDEVEVVIVVVKVFGKCLR